MTVVDMHCHVATPEIERVVADMPRKRAEGEMAVASMGAASAKVTAAMIQAVWPKLTDETLRVRAMDEMGVDVQVLSPSPTQYYYWAEPELADAIVSLQNATIAGLCKQRPERYCGLAQVALQHPELAAKQLRHAVIDLGLVGAEISSSIDGVDLDARSFDPFWKTAEELGAVVFLHPLGTSLGSRVGCYYLSNVIGQPLETTIALSKMIFSGLFDRFPKLRLVAAHGGGYLPLYLGRSLHAYTAREDSHTMMHAPDVYLRKLWFDTVVYEPAALRRLVEQVGNGQVVLGTDYPFDMGDYDVQRIVGEGSGLDDVGRARVLGDNALALLAGTSEGGGVNAISGGRLR